MEEKYKAIKIMNKFEKYNNNKIIINAQNKDIYFKFDIDCVPHLLGLQYLQKNQNKAFGALDRWEYIKKNNLKDEDILNIVHNVFGEKKENSVKKRIETFDFFMNNLEKSFMVEKTKKGGNIPVNYFLIQDDNKEIRHLGIISSDNGGLLIDYENEEKEISDILNTYFINNNYKYFDKSNIIEDIKEIKIYDDILDKYIPFSFDEEKNKYLVKEFYKDEKNFNYQETVKEYEEEKENKENYSLKQAVKVGNEFMVLDKSKLEDIKLEKTDINIKYIDDKIYPLYRAITFEESKKIDNIFDKNLDEVFKINDYLENKLDKKDSKWKKQTSKDELER